MSAKSNKIRYQARLLPETIPALRELAEELGFVVDSRGRYYGDPSPTDLIDAIAAFYLADPSAAANAFTALGIVKSEELE